ncbi:MAG: cellulase family glycosylhydrolase [Alphaproteobacteria bacterium]|nr:cellulase family glycosylhydrolase [Alphaproteobacteria bacterium]
MIDFGRRDATLLLASTGPRELPADISRVRAAFPIPRGYPQAMTTRDNGIFAANGQQMIMRGVCIPDVAWIAQRQDEQMGFFDHRLFSAASAWGCDIMRLSVMPAIWRALGEAHVLRTLDAAVAYARRAGIYLSICWHGIGFPPTDRYKRLVDVTHGPLFDTTTNEMRRFWQTIAQRYARDNVVAYFELFNEPQFIHPNGSLATEHTPQMWEDFRDWAENMVDDIRIIAPNKPIAVGGLQFAYDLSFAAEAPLRRPNIIYCTHPYPDSNWRVPWSRAFLGPRERLPVVVSEWGWDTTAHPEHAMQGGTDRYRMEIMNVMDRAAMGWQAWCFNHTFTPALLADTDYNPSPDFGAFVRLMLIMRKRAALGMRTH